MKIRPYTEADFQAVKEIMESAWQADDVWKNYYPEGWDVFNIKKEINLTGTRDPLFLVAEQEKPVGLIIGQDLASFVRLQAPHLKQEFEQRRLLDAYYQKDIIVHGEHQGAGVGLGLERELIARARRLGYKQFVTRTPPKNSRGINFFARFGFQILFEDNNPERVYFSLSL